MRTLKALFSTLAMGALTVALAATVSAETTAPSATYDKATQTVSAKNVPVADGQTTVLIVEKTKWDNIGTTDLTAADILYINQCDDADATTVLNGMGVKSELVAGTQYVVLVGGENATEIEDIVFSYSAESATITVQLGECDGIAGIDPKDAAAILEYYVGARTFNAEQLAAADCDGITGIDPKDSAAVLEYYVGARTLGTTEIPNPNL